MKEVEKDKAENAQEDEVDSVLSFSHDDKGGEIRARKKSSQ